METLHHKELIRFLSEERGCFPVGLTTRTTPKLKAAARAVFPEGVVRVTRRNGFIGGSYENVYNNALEREGWERDFISQPRKWGTRVNPFLVRHTPKGSDTEKWYLSVFPAKAGCGGVDGWSTPDGRPVSFETVKPFLPEHGDDVIAYRDICLESIVALRIKGFEYVLAS